MRLLSTRYAVAGLAGAVVLAGSGPALGATPAQNAAFAKTLRVELVKTFKKQAPKLVAGKVICVLPKNGTVVHCNAHFTDPSDHAIILYHIQATLLESGVLKWTTTAHHCWSSKTGKKLAC